MTTTQRIDWSQLWYPGPSRAFTAEEMAAAGADVPSATLRMATLVNYVLMSASLLQMAPAHQLASMVGLLVALGALSAWAAHWLWQRPWRKPLMQVWLVAMVVVIGLALSMRWWVPLREERLPLGVVLVSIPTLVIMGLWFLVVWRAQQIEGRLKEQAERTKAIEMAQRLAAAQLEPHFLFNTLASVQHWVHTQDERAAPLLDALVGYLRATLPMFSRPLQPLGDELEAVRRYLQVMGARFGQRLQFSLDVPADLQAQTLPPGLLLTLVENAVVHGVEPLLGGGQVRVQARRVGEQLELLVLDNGPGPGPAPQDGHGLTNCRERLALACGPQAQLRVRPGADGGCVATVTLPWRAIP
jgi:sensor histidine kinase YesM